MSEAPERIWLDGNLDFGTHGAWFNLKLRRGTDIEYVRADIAAAKINELQNTITSQRNTIQRQKAVYGTKKPLPSCRTLC